MYMPPSMGNEELMFTKFWKNEIQIIRPSWNFFSLIGGLLQASMHQLAWLKKSLRYLKAFLYNQCRREDQFLQFSHCFGCYGNNVALFSNFFEKFDAAYYLILVRVSGLIISAVFTFPGG